MPVVTEALVRVRILAASPVVEAGLRGIVATLPGAEPAKNEADVALVDGAGAADPGDLPAVWLGAAPAVVRRLLAGAPGAALAADAGIDAIALALRAAASGLTLVSPALARMAGPEAPPAAEPLTKRETAVLALLGRGLPNKGIARELGLSEHTVKYHVSSILTKLGAESRTAAVTLAVRQGWLAL